MIDEAADCVLELASPQRLGILFKLLSKNLTPSTCAKEIDATRQEVHRNFSRLEKTGLIKKTIDGTYTLTTFGKSICTQVPSLVFLLQNKKYFENHDFGNVPHKFNMRCGQLAISQHVKGVSKVLEQWKNIYKNSSKYIYEVVSEVPHDIIEPLVKQIKKGVKFNYIFQNLL